jgi:hypothetical protein
VAQVDRDVAVEVRGGGVAEGMAHVVGGVVDQYADRPDRGARLRDGGAERPRSVTSQGKNSGRWRASASSSHSASPCSRSTSMKATRLPWRAKWPTKAAPMPVAPPLTSTARPCRLG